MTPSRRNSIANAYLYMCQLEHHLRQKGYGYVLGRLPPVTTMSFQITTGPTRTMIALAINNRGFFIAPADDS